MAVKLARLGLAKETLTLGELQKPTAQVEESAS